MPASGFSQRARRAGGQPISQLMAQALANPELISLAAGFVDQQTLPIETTGQAFDALFSDPASARAALQYGATPGYLPLREQLLDRLRIADGQPASLARVGIEQVIVTPGSNQFLHMAADTLCDPGDIVLCGAPSYFVFLGILGNLGVRAIGVEMDEEGIIPEALEETLARLQASGELPRVKAIYAVTYFDNPSSVTLAAARRHKIVELARRWSRGSKIYVLEDAAYRELRYEGPDIPSLRSCDEAGDTVLLAETFSKSYAPGVRVGWGIVPPELVEPICAQKGNLDFGSPHLTQCLMSTVLERGWFEPHVAALRAGYRPKLEAMLQSLETHLATLPGVHWTRPSGGLYVWLTLPESIDTGPAGSLFHRCVAEGVLYVPGRYSYAAEGAPASRSQMRLSFGVQPAGRIQQGIAALAHAIHDVLQTP